MKFENILLTDFNNHRWQHTDLSNIPRIMDEIKDRARESMLFGELHIDDPYVVKGTSISLSNVSHSIREIYLSGNCIYADVELVDTPAGRIAKDMYETFRSEKFNLRMCGIPFPETITDIITWDYDSTYQTDDQWKLTIELLKK